MIQARRADFSVHYARQKEWIEGRGILLWLAFFFIELGAGTFLVASIFDSLLGMLVGWLMCAVLGGGLHLIFLTHPFRFWRVLVSGQWKTSWISRGFIFLMFFLPLSLLYILTYQFASPVTGLLIAANIFAFLGLIYVGFLMASFNAIPLWNTAAIPVLYAVLGIWGGLGVTLISLLATGAEAEVGTVEQWLQIFLMTFMFVVFVYLFTIRLQGDTGKTSVRLMTTGKWAPLFWLGVVAFGMALPSGVVLSDWLAGLVVPVGLLYFVIPCELLGGDLALRYCILKNGIYSPSIPVRSGAQ